MMPNTKTFSGRLAQHGVKQVDIGMLDETMSDDLKSKIVETEGYREVQSILSEFSAEQKKAGKPHMHP